MAKFDAVFFDLDGTLVDTAPDLAYALNQLLRSLGKPEVDYADFRPIASDGTPAFLKLGIGVTPDDVHYVDLAAKYLALYQTHCSEYSSLFNGMETVLTELENKNIPWGVITNKPEYLAQAVMTGLNLAERAVAIVGGDTTPHSKPHPAPMLHACELAKVTPAHCLYVGDAQRDIEAGQRVKMTTLAALYGYLKDTDSPETWQANGEIAQPKELLNWIG
jgi:phosphoglycolate phosphatase